MRPVTVIMSARPPAKIPASEGVAGPSDWWSGGKIARTAISRRKAEGMAKGKSDRRKIFFPAFANRDPFSFTTSGVTSAGVFSGNGSGTVIADFFGFLNDSDCFIFSIHEGVGMTEGFLS